MDKKEQGSNVREMANKEKAMLMDALQDRYPTRRLLLLLAMSKSSFLL
jgi:hypothetical protein